MSDLPKIEWPATYLGRLQAVTAELQAMGTAASIDVITQRFTDATTVEIEATLAALVLFGRVQKNGELFAVTPP